MQGASPQLMMPPFRGAVRVLVLVSVSIFLAALIVENLFHWSVGLAFGFVPAELVHGKVWQLLTYPFLHDGFFHLLFNMLILWSLGTELETAWGAKGFLAFFFVCAFGAALFYGILGLLSLGVSPEAALVGSSGAIYGMLLAYGILFGERVLYFFMIFPMRAKYFVLILGAVELVSSVFYSSGGIAHAAHLGGMVTGFLYLMSLAAWRKRNRVDYRAAQEAKERKKRLQKAGYLKLVSGEKGEDSAPPKQWH